MLVAWSEWHCRAGAHSALCCCRCGRCPQNDRRGSKPPVSSLARQQAQLRELRGTTFDVTAFWKSLCFVMRTCPWLGQPQAPSACAPPWQHSASSLPALSSDAQTHLLRKGPSDTGLPMAPRTPPETYRVCSSIRIKEPRHPRKSVPRSLQALGPAHCAGSPFASGKVSFLARSMTLRLALKFASIG